MTAPYPDQAAAFAALDARLASRRLAELDMRTRFVLMAIALLISGFFFWQARVPLDGQVRAHGATRGALWLAVALTAWALVAASLTAWRLLTLLARVPGPDWLALPADPARVMRHLTAEARLPAVAAVPPALAMLLAGAGLVPAYWLVLFAAAFALAWLECTRLAAAITRRLMRTDKRDAGLALATRLLAHARSIGRDRARRAPRWRVEPAWRALQRLDLLFTRTASGPRARATGALALFALGLLAWFTNTPVRQQAALAFAAFLPACSILGAWAIARVCSDPPSAMRPLPLSLREVWRARFTTVAGVILAAVLLNALLANGLPPGPRVGLVLTWLTCGLVVATLGLHYGLTLQPRASAAENLYFGWLGATLTSSWMIPLLGWGVLLAGLIHSTMRLPRWWRPEVE